MAPQARRRASKADGSSRAPVKRKGVAQRKAAARPRAAKPRVAGRSKAANGATESSDSDNPGDLEDEKELAYSAKNGLHLHLRPITNVHAAFHDLLSNCKPELDAIASDGGFQFRVGTICSGTEAPIFSLKLIKEISKTVTDGKMVIQFDHVFSVENEPFKQAYISRNARGSTVFRNVMDFAVPAGSSAPTIMGDLHPIPCDIDLLIAGTSCVDFSHLNTKKRQDMYAVEKGVELYKEFKECTKRSGKYPDISKLRDNFYPEVVEWLCSLTPARFVHGAKQMGESSVTFTATICYINFHRPKIAILENVQGAPWGLMCKLYFHAIDYEAAYAHVDTKDYYIPHTRIRGYLVAVDRRVFGNSSKAIVEEWTTRLDTLRRRASAPVQDWLLPANDPLTVIARQDESEKAIAHGLKMGKDVKWDRSWIRHVRFRRLYQLGNERPLTSWGLGGIIKPYDRLDRLIFSNLNDRALDCIDICYLRCRNVKPQPAFPRQSKSLTAPVPYDIRFKGLVFDLSQNVDRTCDRVQNSNRGFGLTGCLTPRGMNVITDQGRLVSGFESMKLQGLPLRDLDLTRESQEQLRDLAGNAMTTTVVGAAIISTLIAIHKHAQNRDSPHFSMITNPEEDVEKYKPRYLPPSTMDCGGDETRTTAWVAPGNVQKVVDLSKRCRRYCYCNGGAKYSTNELLQCQICGIIRCKSCAGNPQHQFKAYPPVEDLVMDDTIPRELMKHFPTALYNILGEDMERSPLTPGYAQNALQDSFLSSLRSSTFSYTKILVSDTVTICYSATDNNWCFHLQAVISDEGVTWYLFLEPWSLDCKKLLEELRLRTEDMSRPFGRVCIRKGDTDYLPLRDDWEFWVYKETSFELIVTKLDAEAKSLQIDIPDINSLPALAAYDLRSMEGTYIHHPECDAAEDSLHACIVDFSKPKRYLFKDPTRIGPTGEDCYVITDDCKFLERHEFRDLVVSLPPSWNPQGSETSVMASVKGHWVKLVTETASASSTCLTNQAGSMSILPRDRNDGWYDPHHQIRTLASVTISTNMIVDTYMVLSRYLTMDSEQWTRIPRSEYSAFFDLLAPINVKLSGFEGKLRVNSSVCASCCPNMPKIHWIESRKDPAKANGALVREPYRLSTEVQRYDEQLRNRKEPFEVAINIKRIDHHSGWRQLTANYEVKTDMLAHRAVSYLPRHSSGPGSVSPVEAFVNIEMGSLRIPNLSFEPFKKSLQSLVGNSRQKSPEVPFKSDKRLTYQQTISLSWMLNKEDPKCLQFTEREIEEHVVEGLNTRALGVAERKVLRRGGILADDVGYGKTILCLALMGVQQPFDQGDSRRMREKETFTEALSASLVLAPRHLVDQWTQEAKDFLGWQGSDVIVVKSTVGLQGLIHSAVSTDETSVPPSKRRKVTSKLEELRNAKLIIVSTAVFDDKYYTWLGKYAGSFAHPQTMPRSNTTKDTSDPNAFGAFQDWYQDATTYARKHVAGFDPEVFKPSRLGMIEERRENLMRTWATVINDHHLTTMSHDDPNSAGQSDEGPRMNTLLETDFGSGSAVLVLEAFSFARIIYDEFSYENFCVAQFVKNADAHSKWILSATPPTTCLKAVCDIARLLDVHVARPVKLRPGLPLITEGPILLHEDSTERQLSYGRLYSDKSVNDRIQQGHDFLRHFSSANPFDVAGLGKISVIETVHYSRLCRGELARYLDVQRDVQNSMLDIAHLSERHHLQMDPNDFPKDGKLRAGLALAYVTSVHCGGRYDDLEGLLQQRQEHLRTAQAKLKHIAGVAIWLILRIATERGRKNTSAREITEDLGAIFEDILAQDLAAFEGPDPLKAVTESFFKGSEVPDALRGWNINAANPQTDYLPLFQILDQDRSVTSSIDYFEFDSAVIHGIDDDDVLHLLEEFSAKGSADLPACLEMDAGGRRLALESLVENALKDGKANGGKSKDDKAKGGKAKGGKAKGGKAKGGKSKGGKSKDGKSKDGKSKNYPKRGFGVQIRGGNYTETESMLCDVMLEIIEAIADVTIRAQQVRAVINLLRDADVRTCDACGIHHDKLAPGDELLFVAQCGHFICKSHEGISCGRIKTTKYPNGSGCPSLVPERTIPVEQIDLCRLDPGKRPVDAMQTSSKTEHICLTVKSILDETSDRILIFYQFDKHLGEICRWLDARKLDYLDMSKENGKTVLGRMTSEDIACRIRFMKISGIEASGLNLQHSNHVMFVNTPVFERQEEFDKYVRQAKGRAIRHGQNKNVHVYYFASANTFDVDLLKQRKKAGLKLGTNGVASFVAKSEDESRTIASALSENEVWRLTDETNWLVQQNLEY